MNKGDKQMNSLFTIRRLVFRWFYVYFDFTIGNYDIDLNTNAKVSWLKPKLYKRDNYSHFVWGKLSIIVENWTLDNYPICAECESTEIGEIGHGDEQWTVCPDCRSVEQGYIYLNKRQFETLVG